MTRATTDTGTAVVVGGSLTGLAAAIALARIGLHVTVVEQTRGFERGGTGLGVDRALLAEVTGSDPRVENDGLPSLPVVITSRETSTWYAIRRWLLTLAARTAGVEFREGVRVESITQDDAHVTLHTTAGALSADIAVGADGYRSILRGAVDPQRPHARYGGFVIWRSLVDESILSPPFAHDPALATRNRDPRVARIIAYAVPGSGGSIEPGRRQITFAWYDASRTAWLAAEGYLSGTEVTRSIPPEAIDATLRESLRRAANDAWRGFVRDVVLTALEAETLFGTPLAEYRPSRLANGRIAIIGDAAHVASPMVGHGLALGWIDAHALAQAIRSTGKPGAAALAYYEQLRLRDVRDHVAESMAATQAMLSAVA